MLVILDDQHPSVGPFADYSKTPSFIQYNIKAMADTRPFSIEIVASDPARRHACPSALDKYGFNPIGVADIDESFAEIEARSSGAPAPVFSPCVRGLLREPDAARS